MSVLRLSDRITLLPILHGSGDFAVAVRRHLLENSFDCLAVPLPPSYQADVEQAIDYLPTPTMVSDQLAPTYSTEWTPEKDQEDNDDDAIVDGRVVSYVPIDPCQGVITALRMAMGERKARVFIDLETDPFDPLSLVLPDPYALKNVSLEKFAAAMVPSIPPPGNDQTRDRVIHMAARLRELEQTYESIIFVCSLGDWPWIRDAYQRQGIDGAPTDVFGASPAETIVYQPEPETLFFMMGELPFITGLYEQARRELDSDENLSVDGVKQLLITSRQAYRADFKNRARKITPQTLSLLLRYIRNLMLMDRRLTPDLYHLVIASKQVAGDSFALHVAEQSREYPFIEDTPYESVTLGIDRIRLPNGDTVGAVSRLPGHPMQWRSCELRPRPEESRREEWESRWNPMSQCSWPPEDEKIENFRTHVADKALAIMGVDLAKSQKFTTSIEDGIDIRETLRNWHTGDLYVKVLPPSQGRLDAVVMLFDSPADPRDYAWRSTWFAEHQNESTLAFFATDFGKEVVGPGIALANYGGALFLFPPVHIPNIWTDRRLDFTNTLEERVLAAACLHSECPQIALLSSLPPGAGWRRLARRYKKSWVHVPLTSFSQSTIQQLRMVHVLNGHEVRSYASDFIRKA